MIGNASGDVCMSGPSHNKKLRGCKLTMSVDVLSGGKIPLPVKARMSRLNIRTRVARRTRLMGDEGVDRRTMEGQRLLQLVVERTNFHTLGDR